MSEHFNPHENTTIDGVLITPGLVVWDYNLKVSVVQSDRDAEGVRCPDWCDGNHWFDTTGGMFDGGRMWVRHPSTGVRAKREEVMSDEL